MSARWERLTAVASIALIGLSLFSGMAFARTKLVVTTWWNSVVPDWEEAIIKPFEAEMKDVDVEIQVFSWGEYFTKQLASLAGGAPLGDVMLIDAKWAQDVIAAGGMMLDLAPLLQRDGRLRLRDFVPSSLREYRAGLADQGPLYGLPIVSSTQILYYNKTSFDQAGIGYPDESWTWNDLAERALKLTRDVNGDGKTDFFGFAYDLYGLDSAVRAFGGRLISNDLKHATMNSPEVSQAIKFYRDLYQRQVASWGSGPFWQGNGAMSIMGDWNIDGLFKSKVGFEWDVALLPKGPAGRFSLGYSNALFIPKQIDPAKINYAWELIRWIATNPERKRVEAIYLSMMPSYIPLALSNEYVNGVPRINRRVMLETNQRYAFTDMSPGYMEWHDKIWANWAAQAIRGQIPPEQAGERSAQEINAKGVLLGAALGRK